jgi:hypothetical protein
MSEHEIGTEHYRWTHLHLYSNTTLRYYVNSGRFAIVVKGGPQASFERGHLEELMDALEEPK